MNSFVALLPVWVILLFAMDAICGYSPFELGWAWFVRPVLASFWTFCFAKEM